MDGEGGERERLPAELAALWGGARPEGGSVGHEPTGPPAADEHRRTAGGLTASQATIEALLQSTSEGILIVDEKGHIQAVNAGTERMFGYSADELLGQSVEALLPERFRARHTAHRVDYFTTPRVRSMGRGLDLAARRKDGREFPVEISLSSVSTEAGWLAMAFITDITERKRTESQVQRQREVLHQTEKLAALGKLAAGLAHEINNPIGIISSRIELMLDEAEGHGLPPRAREDLEVLQRNVRRVGHIAHGLLSFARQAPRERAPVDLNRVVEETLLLVEQQLVKAGIMLRRKLAPELPCLLADASALQQVMVNLVTNAREALAGSGEVAIETRPAPEQPGWIQLVVADNGPGIAPDVLPRIFDPFVTTKPQGTGLGLAVSYGIVQDHGGTLEVETEPDKGTTFTLTLPATADGAPEARPPA